MSEAPVLKTEEVDPQVQDEDKVPEEEITKVDGWTASITLALKASCETGEEDESPIFTQRAKLYRFVANEESDSTQPAGEWKERGTGDVKLLKSKSTQLTRLLMRQEKTNKIVANHYVIEDETLYVLQPNAGSDKFWVWQAQDFAEDEAKVETLAIKFGTAEKAKEFQTAFNVARKENSSVKGKSQQKSESPKSGVSKTAAPNTESPKNKSDSPKSKPESPKIKSESPKGKTESPKGKTAAA